MRTRFLTPFGEDEVFVRIGIMRQLHIVKMIPAIPMKADTPNILCGLRVVQHNFRPLIHPVTIMIPNNNFDMA